MCWIRHSFLHSPPHLDGMPRLKHPLVISIIFSIYTQHDEPFRVVRVDSLTMPYRAPYGM